MEESSPQKIYVGKDNKATMICPRCGRSKAVDVSAYMEEERSPRIKIRFRCGLCVGDHCGEGDGVRTTVMLERRKYFRKPVKLAGSLLLSKNHVQANIQILEVSRQGIGFHINTPNILEENDEGTVEFRLDDRKRTLLRFRVVVRKIRGSVVGAGFARVDPDDQYQKAIGFYLFN